VESAIFIYTRRVLAFFRVKPAKSFNQHNLFYPKRLLYQSSGQPRVNPGKQEGGGVHKKSKNRRVSFSRYIAANDAGDAHQVWLCSAELRVVLFFQRSGVGVASSRERSRRTWVRVRVRGYPRERITHALVLLCFAFRSGVGEVSSRERNRKMKSASDAHKVGLCFARLRLFCCFLGVGWGWVAVRRRVER